MKREAVLILLLLASCGRPSGEKTETLLETPAVEVRGEKGIPATGKSVEVVSVLSQSPADSKPLVELSGDVKPEIAFLKTGSILPSDGNMQLLFKSSGYGKAQVRVRKIYTKNILQYLQTEHYGNWNLPRVSGEVADTLLQLGNPQGEVYSLDMSGLIRTERGAIYHVEIRGREPVSDEDFWDSDMYFGNSETYARRSVDLLASDLGLIVKKDDDGIRVWACDLLSSLPVQGVQVKLFDYAQQQIASGFTDSDGCVSLGNCDDAFFVCASWRADKSYLPIGNASSLSTSNFDVSGSEHQKGIKVCMFGERGVWRPGEAIHVTAVTFFGGKVLPEGHPIVAELLNPDGQVVQTANARLDGGNIYHFPFRTSENAVTGRWSVRLTLGGSEFTKGIRIETVKPNNLDINMDFGGKDILPAKGGTVGVSVNWLYGAPGSKLKVNAEAVLRPSVTKFREYPGYSFNDNAVGFEEQTVSFPEITTDKEGRCNLPLVFDLDRSGIPGMLNAEISVRASEPTGEFSTAVSGVRISPYERFVGIRTDMDTDGWASEFLNAGKSHCFDVVSTDADGHAIDGGTIRAEVFHVSWSWWWNAASEIATYMSGNARELLFTQDMKTRDGKASFRYDWADAPEGLYYIRVRDVKGGHSSSLLCEVRKGGESKSGESDAAIRLGISSNKESYQVGETARLTVPSAPGSHVLVSLEKGGRLLDSFWLSCKGKSTDVSIPVTADMAPNVYAFLTLVQPHGNTLNDAPIRLYGVKNIDVTDKRTKLEPTLDIPAQIKPQTRLKFKVREKSGRPMQYVVAVVDEGLLSLTGFKTPDPWKAFYAKEALRVRTWDLYDDVIGAYGGKIDRLFAIGGDDAASVLLGQKKASRFTPVVSYLGPFSLPAGRVAEHGIDIPQYIGSLRAMVIATDGHAQGSCEKNVTVSKPLMVKASLPRSVCSGEKISVPVTLMALESGVGKVRVELKAEGALKLVGSATAETVCNNPGQEILYFELEADRTIGAGSVTVTAQSGSDKSVSHISLDVTYPNGKVSEKKAFVIDAGKELSADVELFGIGKSSSVSVECSSIPSVDLGRRLGELTSYPYGCLEQTVSKAFPQLFLPSLTDCDEAMREGMATHVETAIRKLQTFRTPEGGLSYWPGTGGTSAFCTAYALHFMNEAAKAGYAVPEDLKGSVVRYLKDNVAGNSDAALAFSRAYSLFALSGAGEPQRGQMNKMYERLKEYDCSTVWMLAAAYALDGKRSIAGKMTEGLSYSDREYAWHGSEDRNMAIALKVLGILEQREEAMKLAISLAGRMNDSDHWMSTQAAAWCLCSLGEFASGISGDAIDASIEVSGRKFNVCSSKALASCELLRDMPAGKLGVKFRNKGKAPLYVCMTCTGVPEAGAETSHSSGLKLSVSYVDDRGSAVDIGSLARGTAFNMVAKISNTGRTALRNVALSQKIPSGWEIVNRRVWSEDGSAPAGLDWQDFRDNRVDSFLDLPEGDSRTVRLRFVATYPGRYYLPACTCEAMYDGSVSAVVPGRWVEVK